MNKGASFVQHDGVCEAAIELHVGVDETDLGDQIVLILRAERRPLVVLVDLELHGRGELKAQRRRVALEARGDLELHQRGGRLGERADVGAVGVVVALGRGFGPDRDDFVGGLQHHEMSFRNEGTNSALGVLTALATFILVMPVVTVSTPGPDFTKSQLAFAGIASFALYGAFLFFQTVSHRDYYLPKAEEAKSDHNIHADKPSNLKTIISIFLLFLCLVTVVGLAEALSPAIEAGVKAAGAPKTVVGIAIALLVLMPESFAAVRAAKANRLQSSLNLALGSALASIGLTIPTVAAIAIFFNLPLSLGISELNMVLMYLSFFIGALTLAIGRTTVLQGVVHLIIFFEYLFLSLVP